jgi:hypothetical protein
MENWMLVIREALHFLAKTRPLLPSPPRFASKMRAKPPPIFREQVVPDGHSAILA